MILHNCTHVDLDIEVHPSRLGMIPFFEFDVQHLQHLAETKLHATSCVNIKLLGFGIVNKAYLLTFSDGLQAVMRLPHGEINDFIPC
jgi:hypothetical protein